MLTTKQSRLMIHNLVKKNRRCNDVYSKNYIKLGNGVVSKVFGVIKN